MIYWAYEALRHATRPAAWLFEGGTALARDARNPLRDTLPMRALATSLELPARALKDYKKPEYRIWTDLGDMPVRAEQRIAASLPFADLLNFRFDDESADCPKVIIASALSGHHATLLQDTVRTFARDFDTYIVDWKDARKVPAEAGPFGFDDYVEHLVRFVEALGPDTHLLATCQAAPPAMVASAILARDNPALVPASLTLMGGPVDTRISPTFITRLADKLPLKLFELNNIKTLPWGHPGSGRRVYPGFYQLAGFILLNPRPHLKQYARFVRNSLKGDEQALASFRAFYDEYFAVLDTTKAFYIETLRKVFFEHHIPRGMMEYRGKLVDFAAIENMPLLTVEGGNDHLCPPGQTEAAHLVFSGIPDALKHNHVEPGVGHYGLFSGSKFRSRIYPVIRAFMDPAGAASSDEARETAVARVGVWPIRAVRPPAVSRQKLEGRARPSPG